jgi:serine protease Do
VAETVAPSIVRIGRGWGRGAGIVVAEGAVLTNAHNLRGDETTVTFADGRSATGTVAGLDGDGDLAVIRVDTGSTPVIAWAAGGGVVVGSPVFAVTTSPGYGVRVTFGLVSSVGQAFRGPRGRRIAGSIEHTAPLVRGSSGGPIVDAGGALLGVNTNRIGDGFYLALPADAELRRRVDALGRGESPTRRTLGVALAPPQAARAMRRAVGLPERDGLLVRQVAEDSVAAAAGIQVGDLLVSAGGRPLLSVDDCLDALDGVPDGGSIDLQVVRGTDERTVNVAFPAAAA